MPPRRLQICVEVPKTKSKKMSEVCAMVNPEKGSGMTLTVFVLICLGIGLLLAFADLAIVYWMMRNGDPHFKDWERRRFMSYHERMNGK